MENKSSFNELHEMNIYTIETAFETGSDKVYFNLTDDWNNPVRIRVEKEIRNDEQLYMFALEINSQLDLLSIYKYRKGIDFENIKYAMLLRLNHFKKPITKAIDNLSSY